MNKYKLVSINDANNQTELEAATFQEAVEEALETVQWYIIDEGDYYTGVNGSDPNDEVELSEQIYEDAQYEILERLGYFIASSV